MSNEEDQTSTAVAGRSKPFVMWLALHMRQCAILYCIGTYLIFAVVNNLWLDIGYEDVYWFAMIVSGLFWLGVRELISAMERRAT